MIVSGKVSLVKTAIALRWRLFVVLLVSLAVTTAYEWLNHKEISIQITPITALGVAIGLFLGFRCNVVWSRYWEARTLWGRLINASRTLARQLATLVDSADAPQAEAFVRDILCRQLAFVHAFRAHLREENPTAHLATYLPESDIALVSSARNVPVAILHGMGEQLHGGWKSGLLSEYRLIPLDAVLSELTEVLGGCERIKNTPIPPAFTYVSHRLMQAYCCLVPFALVSDLGWFTPPVALIIAFAFLALDDISDLIEQPFSTAENDLPLDSMTRTIEIDLLQRLGEKDIPPPIQPVNGVLL